MPSDLNTATPNVRARLRLFATGSYVLWLVTAALIAFVFHNDRHDWFLLLSWTLVFPFSALADKHVLMIRYNPAFPMLFDETPRMIPFACAWFFTLPLEVAGRVRSAATSNDHPYRGNGPGGLRRTLFIVDGHLSLSLVQAMDDRRHALDRADHRRRRVYADIPWPRLLRARHARVGLLPTFGLSYCIYAGLFCAVALFNAVLIRGLLRLKPVDTP
jgi:hypothetical protein